MIRKKRRSNYIKIDLSGEQGNAFYLLGLANSLAKRLNMKPDKILNEMKSGDYENLINVFDKYFGSIVILYR